MYLAALRIVFFDMSRSEIHCITFYSDVACLIKVGVTDPFVRGIHRWPVDSPFKGSVRRTPFPFSDVIMHTSILYIASQWGIQFRPYHVGAWTVHCVYSGDQCCKGDAQYHRIGPCEMYEYFQICIGTEWYLEQFLWTFPRASLIMSQHRFR